MKRVILSIPEGTTLESLTVEQQVAIRSVFGQFSLPMPGTIPFNLRVLCDAVTADNFDPSVMPGLGIDWPVVGLWQWDGANAPVELQALDSGTLLAHLPDVVTYNEAGEIVSTLPPTLHVPHIWAGWPAVEV